MKLLKLLMVVFVLSAVFCMTACEAPETPAPDPIEKPKVEPPKKPDTDTLGQKPEKPDTDTLGKKPENPGRSL